MEVVVYFVSGSWVRFPSNGNWTIKTALKLFYRKKQKTIRSKYRCRQLYDRSIVKL